jgi:hypothetical protein
MAVTLVTNHYRFGIDELAESTHNWYANEDANPASSAIPVDTTFLLRFNVQETGASAAANVDMQFQCSLNGGAFQDITTTSTIVKAVAAAALTNAGNCTKRLSGTGTFESSGAGQTEDGLSGGNNNDIAASGCSETECGLQIVGADAPAGSIITFRLTSPDFTITNNVVPTLKLSLVPSAFSEVTVADDGVTVALIGDAPAAVLPTVSDAVTLEESVTVLLTKLVPTVNDAVTVSESTTLLLTSLVPAVSDAITVAEDCTVLLTTLNVSAFDAVTLEESAVVLLTVLTPTVFDAITVAEDVSVALSSGIVTDLSIEVFDLVTVSEETPRLQIGKYRGTRMFTWEGA